MNKKNEDKKRTDNVKIKNPKPGVLNQKVKDLSEKYYILFEQANDAIFLLDGKKIIECNSKAIEFFGCDSKDDIIEHSPIEFSPKKQPDGEISSKKALEYIKAALNNEPMRFYWKHARKDGTLFDAEISLNRLTIGKKAYIQAIVRDITEQMKIEYKLKESREMFKQVTEQSPSVYELYDINGLQIEVNKAYEILWGFPREHTVGKFNVLKSQEVVDTGLIEYVNRAYAGETVQVPPYKFDPTGETEAKGKGRIRWLNTCIYPIKDNYGIVQHIVITHEDITDKKVAEEKLNASNQQLRAVEQQLRASNQQLMATNQQLEASNQQLTATNQQLYASEKAIKESHERYYSLFDNMSEGFALHEIICNEEGAPIDYRFLEINSSFERETGLEAENIIGKTVLEVMPGIEQYWIDTYGTVALTGKAIKFEQYAEVLDKYYEVIAYSPQKNRFATIFIDISQRKKTEEALKSSEKKIRTWLANSPVCTKIVDLDFNLQYMSQAGIAGLQIDDISEYYGKPYPFYFYPKSFKDTMTKNLKKAKETGAVIEQEAPVVDKEGNTMWFHSTIVPVKNDKDKIEYLMVVSSDTTKRNMAEEALRASEEKYRNFLDNLSDIAYEADGEGNLTYVNKISEKIAGVSLDDVIGKSFLPLFIKEDHDSIIDVYNRALKGEVAQSTITFLNGTICHFTSEPRYNDKGQVVGTRGIGRDITEQKQVEDELKKYRLDLEELVKERSNELIQTNKKLKQEILEREKSDNALLKSEHKFRLLFERAPLGYQALDEKGILIDVNKAWLNEFGYLRNEVIGKPFTEFIYPDHIDRFNSFFPNFILHGNIEGEEFEIVKKDGERLIVALSGSIGVDESGHAKQLQCILHNITYKKVAENKMKAEMAELERFTDIAVSRELKMEKMQKKIKELEAKLESYEEEK